MDEFHKVRDQNFGIPAKSDKVSNQKAAVHNESFYNTLAAADVGSTEFEDIIAEQFHVKHGRYSGGTHSKVIVYVNYAIACLHLLKTGHGGKDESFEHDFPLRPRDPEGKVGFLGYEWEDWHRAFCLVKFCTKNITRAKTDTDTTRQLSVNKAISILPVYLTADDLQTNFDVENDVEQNDLSDKEGDDEKMKKIKARMRFDKAIYDFTNAVKEDDRTLEQQNILKLQADELNTRAFLSNTQALENAMMSLSKHNSRNFATNKNRIERDPITRNERLNFMKHQAQNAKAIWDITDIEADRAKVALEKTQDGEQQPQLQMYDLVTLARKQADREDDLDIDEAQDKEDRVDQATESELERIQELAKDAAAWEMRESMGTQGAQLPGYKESCEWAGLDPEDLTIESAPRVEGQDPWRYKYHQVVSKFPTPYGRPTIKTWKKKMIRTDRGNLAAHFMAQSELKPWHGCIVGLACGLGKTLTTLLQIMGSVKQQQAQQAAGQEVHYAATCIQCPAASVEVWMADIERFCPNVFQVYQFYGTTSTVTNQKRQKNLVDPAIVDTLNDILNKLDSEDPKVS